MVHSAARVDCAAELLISANLPADYAAGCGAACRFRLLPVALTDEQRRILDEPIEPAFGEPPAERHRAVDTRCCMLRPASRDCGRSAVTDGCRSPSPRPISRACPRLRQSSEFTAASSTPVRHRICRWHWNKAKAMEGHRRWLISTPPRQQAGEWKA